MLRICGQHKCLKYVVMTPKYPATFYYIDNNGKISLILFFLDINGSIKITYLKYNYLDYDNQLT